MKKDKVVDVDFNESIKNNKGKIGGLITAIIVAIIAFVIISGSFYSVEEEEQAVILWPSS